MTPPRARGVEILDDPATTDDVRRDAMADVARSNALFGGTAVVLRALRAITPMLGRRALVLDVGAGIGDVGQRAQSMLARAGVDAAVIGVDLAPVVAATARRRLGATAACDARRLPVRDARVDVVICSQLLHHFERGEAVALIAELERVSRGWVVIADLRRSRLAAAAFWLASTALRFHAVTRHDGVVSVMRGFTGPELADMVREATGRSPTVRHGAFWRVSATWQAGTVAA